MKEENTYQHPDLGELRIRENVRARRYVFRPSEEGGLVVTAPCGWSIEHLLQAIEPMVPQLQEMQERYNQRMEKEAPRQLIDFDFAIRTESLLIELKPEEALRGKVFTVRVHKDMGHVVLLCPPDTDFQEEGRQQWLQKVIEEQVRSYARGILPARLRHLSEQFGLPVKEVHVNAARGRWGSCVSRKRHSLFHVKTEYTINLSIFTLLLPASLQRLVLLHELTHTVEMNHSPRFHQRLNAMLGGNEKQLEKELKRYQTSIFSFAEKQK